MASSFCRFMLQFKGELPHLSSINSKSWSLNLKIFLKEKTGKANNSFCMRKTKKGYFASLPFHYYIARGLYYLFKRETKFKTCT